MVVGTMSVEKRVFIGSLNQNIDSCCIELHKRFQKFGNCKEDQFEKHHNFAYINMNFNEESDFLKLKLNFNNLKFKGNLIKIDLAKPDWQTNWATQTEKDMKDNIRMEKFNAKQNWEHYKKLENIKMTWKDHREIIKGRMRKDPRSKVQLRNVTFRISVDGSLKVYKCYKNKLWGYERNKEIKDLVYKFIGQKWRNGHDHIVDRLDYSRSKQSIGFISDNSNVKISLGIHAPNKEERVQDIDNLDDEELEILQEKEKVHDALSKVLDAYDFDKPATVIDSDDEFDLNAEAKKMSTSHNKHQYNEYEQYQQEYYEDNKNNYAENHESRYDNYNNDDYENYENQYNENANNQYNDSNQKKNEKYQDNKVVEEKEKEEFIPTFAAHPSIEELAAKEGTISNTDKLRSLFNPNKAEDSFKLIEESNGDIDEGQNIHDNFTQSNHVDESFVESVSLLKQGDKNQLFFPHFKSPFLVGQSQLNKVQTSMKKDILDNWENEFWENRGTWMKDMKNKKRDAVRQIRKRQSKIGGGLLI